jgi:hypothetical protein
VGLCAYQDELEKCRLVDVAEVLVPSRDVVCALLILLVWGWFGVLVVVDEVVNDLLQDVSSHVGKRDGGISTITDICEKQCINTLLQFTVQTPSYIPSSMFLMVTDCWATTVGTVKTLLSELSSLSEPEDCSAAIMCLLKRRKEEEERRLSFVASWSYEDLRGPQMFCFCIGWGATQAGKLPEFLAYFALAFFRFFSRFQICSFR